MRLTILTRPGEKHGPCEQCRHDECAEQRELASTVCHCCQDLIGFHRAFCFDADRRPVHFACLSIEIERHARLLGIEAETVTTPIAPLLYDKPAAAKLLNISEYKRVNNQRTDEFRRTQPRKNRRSRVVHSEDADGFDHP